MSIEIPDEALESPQRLLEETLCSLWSQGRVSSGKAAKFFGISRQEFWSLAGERGYHWPYTVDDLDQDVENLKALGRL